MTQRCLVSIGATPLFHYRAYIHESALMLDTETQPPFNDHDVDHSNQDPITYSPSQSGSHQNQPLNHSPTTPISLKDNISNPRPTSVAGDPDAEITECDCGVPVRACLLNFSLSLRGFVRKMKTTVRVNARGLVGDGCTFGKHMQLTCPTSGPLFINLTTQVHGVISGFMHAVISC